MALPDVGISSCSSNLFAYACEGVCPFKALAGHFAKGKSKSKDEDHGIISRVLRVPQSHYGMPMLHS